MKIFSIASIFLAATQARENKEKKKKKIDELLLYNLTKLRFCSLAAVLCTDGKEAGGSGSPPREIWAVFKKKNEILMN